MRQRQLRGGLCGTVAAGEKVSVHTSDGVITFLVLDKRGKGRGGEDRFGVRVDAPRSVRIAFPHVGHLAMQTGG